MCGIFGVYGGTPVEGEWLRRATRTLVHRGPDDEGYFVDGGVALGMRRLSIIDVEGGHQPIASEDGQVIAVFNGEIYNFADLREGLIARGHVFTTRSDTECIVHGYEEHGVGIASLLNGMFAIGLYDRARQRLILMRDRMGKKPLYYARVGDRFLFASEIKALLDAEPSLRRPNPRAIPLFFRFGFMPEPETMYADVFQLPPASVLVLEDGQTRIDRYWDITFPPAPCRERPSGEDADELDALLREAVRSRLVSDVPLGAFLSGGPDSSLIVAYMSQLMDRPVKAFTIAYDEADFDEQADARRVAEHCGADHRILTLRLGELRQSFFETIDAVVRSVDGPFGDSSAFPTYHVSELARRDVTVVLSGDGADEIFGGYTLYQGLRFAQLYQRIPGPVRRGIVAPSVLAAIRAAGKRAQAETWRKRLSDSELPLREMLASKFSIASPEIVRELVPATREILPGAEIAGTGWIDFGATNDPFSATLYANARFHLVNQMLVKLDRMSMARSVEVRCPFLDHRVVELAASLPASLKLRRFETKAILRDVAARHLPASTARKRKHGFGVPIGLWLREPLWAAARERLLESAGLREHTSRTVLERLLSEHRDGAVNHSALLWSLLTFEAWSRLYLEGPPP